MNYSPMGWLAGCGVGLMLIIFRYYFAFGNTCGVAKKKKSCRYTFRITDSDHILPIREPSILQSDL